MRTFFLPALLFVAFSAFAAAPLTFEEVDTDGDGLISADEAASVEGLDFDAADADADGTLSVDEYDIAVAKLPPAAEPTVPDNGEAAMPTTPPTLTTPTIPKGTQLQMPSTPAKP